MLDPLTIARTVAASGDRPLVIALSGGGDSAALMHLLTESIGAHRLHAVVVDHALRDGSAADAARAANFAQTGGVSAEIVTIDWREPRALKRSQQQARTARYTALCETARRVGAVVIATGHTRDDQAETVLLRGERGSGWRGLAGMRAFAPLPFWPEGRGLFLARPLLARRRGALRAYLQTRGADWIEDPANTNDAYARVRARRTLAELEANGVDTMRLAALAERLAPGAEALDAKAGALIAAAAAFEADTVALERAAWLGDSAVRQRALAVLLAAAGGAERTPGDDQVAALDAKMQAANFRAATLSGCVVSVTKTAWLLTRDRGALTGRADGAPPPPALPLTPERWTIWDRRVALRPSQTGWTLLAENGTPMLAKGSERRALTEAAPNWLLAERAAHLLGVANQD